MCSKELTTDDDLVIKFDHVYKTYYLYRSDREHFKSIFWSKEKCDKRLKSIHASNDLCFEIHRGEAVAFFGHNGAGKSTALKMITGVSNPSAGEITVNGSVNALLELKAGFAKNLTGRENLYQRCLAMGIPKSETEDIVKKAIKFADLGDYIDQPISLYSSGMKSRLGFGFVVNSKADILVVDEALSVGDKRFKKKCKKRISEIMADGNVTVLFVTHSLSTAKEFCERGIVLEHGVMKFDGPIEDAIAYYDAMQ